MLPALSCPWEPQGNTPQTPADLLVPVSGLETGSFSPAMAFCVSRSSWLHLSSLTGSSHPPSLLPALPSTPWSLPCERQLLPGPAPSLAHFNPPAAQWAAFLGHRPPGAGLAGLPSPSPSLSPSSCFPVHPGEFKVGFDPDTFNMWFRLPGSPFLAWSVGPALTPSPRQTGIGVGSSGGSARTERMPRPSFEGHAAGPGPLRAVSRPRPQLRLRRVEPLPRSAQ